MLDLDPDLDLCLKIRSPGASLVAGRRSLGSPDRKGKREKRERKRVSSGRVAGLGSVRGLEYTNH